MKLPLTIGAKVASAIYDAEGVPVCLIDSMQEASREEEREMARRIVACVNACAAIPTDKLEAMAADPIEGMFGRLAGKAISENRVLLEALEGIVNAYDAPNKSLAHPIVAARKAIARVKGQTFTEMGGVCRCDECGFLWLEGDESGEHTCKGGAA